MEKYRTHVFVCTYGPYCGFDGDVDRLLSRLKQRVSEAGLGSEVRINRAGCLNQCGHGPNVVVYPDGVWYCGVQVGDADTLFEEHIVHGRPVERLLSALPAGNNKDTSGYPQEVHAFKHAEKQRDAQRAEDLASARAAIASRQGSTPAS